MMLFLLTTIMKMKRRLSYLTRASRSQSQVVHFIEFLLIQRLFLQVYTFQHYLIGGANRRSRDTGRTSNMPSLELQQVPENLSTMSDCNQALHDNIMVILTFSLCR